ncbi:beta strand repeat-containing protein [Deinococcus yavapaiensis]|uniref:Ig-like domain-containing protein n=1 Tax=Deinococcus yavapaiensis KR-236 TaxID=694435 RepID=A0A318SA58_9DEIO|nr:Ig-like domain-containing protein [Deinococcus yavapaiensis]PYE53370.1 Ig-like domain-containing protein [Deinococcus yavapaiensis KR-236]
MRRKSNPALAVVALTVTLAACGPQIAAPGAINNLPASVALEPIQVGATASSTIAFTNGGGSSLSYAVSSDVAWLTASPSSATVPANTATSLTVNVTCPVVPGPYTANVTITSQNPNLSKTVPVTVTCAPEANTEANRPVLQLGNIATSVTTPSITVTGTVGDNVALQSLKVNGATVTVGTGGAFTYTVNNLTPGNNVITVVATDTSGLQTTRTATVVYTPASTDTQAPLVSNVALTNTATTGSVQGSVTATDNVAVTTLAYTVTPAAGGAAVKTGAVTVSTPGSTINQAFTIDLSSLADGTYKIAFTASDGTNTSAAKESASFIVDKTGPTFTPIYISPVTASTASVTLGNLQDALSNVSSTVSYTLNGAAAQTATLSNNAFTITGLQEGTNSITITAKDALGNATTKPIQIVFTAVTPPPPPGPGDTQAPVITSFGYNNATTGVFQGFVTATDNVAVTGLSYTVAPSAGGAVVKSGTVPVQTPGTSIDQTFSLDLSSLADGSYKITFTASDGVNTSAPFTSAAFTLDKTGPTFTPSAAASVNVNSVNVTLNGLQDALSTVSSSVTYKINGGVTQTATLSGNAFTAMNLQSGVNSIAITVKDSLGNATTKTIQVTYDMTDTQAPVVTNVSLGSTATTGTLQGSVTATDNVAVTGLSYTVAPSAGGAVVASGTLSITAGTSVTKAFSLDLSSLADGSYKVTFTASDGTSTSAPSTSTAFTLDKTGPTFTPSAAASVNVNSVNVTLNGLQDALSTVSSSVTYKINGGATQTATLSGNAFTATNLQSGVNSIAITVKDSLGNATTKTIQVTYNAPDTQAPVVTNVSLGSTATTGTLQGSVTATDNVAVTSLSYTVAPSAGGASVLSGTLSITAGASVSELFSLDLSSLADGSYKIAFTASDGTSTSAPFTSAAFTLDKTGPTFTPSATSPVGTSSTTVTLNGLQDALSSVNSTVSYTVNGGSAQAATLSSNAFTVTNLQEGANSVAITVSDSLGNTSTQTIQITSDTQLPNLSVTPIAAYVSSPDLNITGTATDSGTGIAFVTATPDGDTTQTITTTVDGNGNFTLTLLDLAEGAHSIVVTTTDIFGRTSDPQTITTFVDATPPTLTNIASSISSNNVTVTGTASDIAGSGVDHVTYSVTKDGAPFITATNVTVDSAGFFSIPLTGLANGSYVVTLAAVDLSGNSSTASTVSVNVQTGAPSVLINSIATSAGSGTITGTISDNNSPLTATSYQITDASSTVVRSGTLTSTNPFSISYSGLAVGTYTFTVSATNALGTTSQSSTFVVDQTPPTVTLVSSTFVKNGVNARGRFVVQATDANGVASVQYRLLGASTWTNATSIGNNRYSFSARIKNATSVTVEVRATDTAGNVSVPVTFTAP